DGGRTGTGPGGGEPRALSHRPPTAPPAARLLVGGRTRLRGGRLAGGRVGQPRRRPDEPGAERPRIQGLPCHPDCPASPGGRQPAPPGAVADRPRPASRTGWWQPGWLAPDVLGIARTAYVERAWDRLPILADALEDARCSDEAILSHLRGSGPHVRGCWVVDLLLGNRQSSWGLPGGAGGDWGRGHSGTLFRFRSATISARMKASVLTAQAAVYGPEVLMKLCMPILAILPLLLTAADAMTGAAE